MCKNSTTDCIHLTTDCVKENFSTAVLTHFLLNKL